MMHIFPHWCDRKNVSLTPGAAGYRCGRGHPALDLRPSGVEERRIIRKATEEASLCTLALSSISWLAFAHRFLSALMTSFCLLPYFSSHPYAALKAAEESL